LQVFWHLRTSCRFIGCLGGGVGAFAIEGGCLQVLIFQGGKELAGFDDRAALNVKVLDRRGDLWRKSSLGQGREYAVDGDVFGYGTSLGFFSLHGDHGLRNGFLFRAAQD